jgi:hypothetical protein
MGETMHVCGKSPCLPIKSAVNLKLNFKKKQKSFSFSKREPEACGSKSAWTKSKTLSEK